MKRPQRIVKVRNMKSGNVLEVKDLGLEKSGVPHGSHAHLINLLTKEDKDGDPLFMVIEKQAKLYPGDPVALAQPYDKKRHADIDKKHAIAKEVIDEAINAKRAENKITPKQDGDK